jgi:hypothetical protein
MRSLAFFFAALLATEQQGPYKVPPRRSRWTRPMLPDSFSILVVGK